MVNQYINRYTLKFFNSSYEDEFSTQDVRRKYKLQLAIAIFYTVMTSLNLILYGYNLGIIIHTSVLYLCVLVGYYKRKWVCYTNVVIIIVTQITYINFIISGEGKMSIGEIFLNGQGASSIYLLSSQSFTLDTIAVICCQVLIRIFMKEIPSSYFLDAFQIILINATSRYLQFRQERCTFFEKKKEEQWNQSLDNLFSNGIIITKYDQVTCKVSLHGKNLQVQLFGVGQSNQYCGGQPTLFGIHQKYIIQYYPHKIIKVLEFGQKLKYIQIPIISLIYKNCNQQARKFKIEDDDSFLNFSKSVKIDFSRSKISVLLQNDKNTLKDYLLLKHYNFSNLKPIQQVNSVQQKQEQQKINQGASDNNSSINKNKNDVLHVIYENHNNPNNTVKFKIKAGILVFEQPYIILSLQDISSESNLSNLKMKSAANDLIYIKSINEIRDKVVKIIGIISSSRFFMTKSISNAPNQGQNRIFQDDPQVFIANASQYLFGKQRSFNESRQETLNSKKEDYIDIPPSPIHQFLQDQVTFQPNSEYHSQHKIPSPTHSERNIQISTFLEAKEKNPHVCLENNMNDQQKNNISIQNQDNQQVILQPQKSGNSNTTFSKSNVLQIPGQSDQILSTTAPQVLISGSNPVQFQAKTHDNSFTIRLSDMNKEEFSEINSELRSNKPSQNQNQYQRIMKKTSFNQSYYEGDSLQYIENDDIEGKIANLRLSMSCLLNNTYSLLDYMILSNEKSHYKKLTVKPQIISLRKIESYLKFLFPNLIVTYSTIELSEREIKTDIRRVNSFFYKKKDSEVQISTTNRRVSSTLNFLSDQSPIQQPNSIKKQIISYYQQQQISQQQQQTNYQYDKQIEIYLHISLTEQPQFNSINFSIQNTGSINIPNVDLTGYQTLNGVSSQVLKNKSDTLITNGRSNRKSEPELLLSMTAASLSVNATADPIIKQMEIKNIYFNIMRLGPFIPEYEPSINLFSFDVFENIEVIDVPNKNPISPNFSLNTLNQTQGITSNHNLNINNLYPKTPTGQQHENTTRNARKSNFYQGNISPNATFPNIKSQENIKNKSAQNKNKLTSNENVLSKKKLPKMNDLIKQLEITKIKENIHQFDDECDVSSYKTFMSGLDQKIEEHLQDSIIQSRKLPISFWNIQEQI